MLFEETEADTLCFLFEEGEIGIIQFLPVFDEEPGFQLVEGVSVKPLGELDEAFQVVADDEHVPLGKISDNACNILNFLLIEVFEKHHTLGCEEDLLGCEDADELSEGFHTPSGWLYNSSSSVRRVRMRSVKDWLSARLISFVRPYRPLLMTCALIMPSMSNSARMSLTRRCVKGRRPV